MRQIVIKPCEDSDGEKRQANSWIKKFVLSHGMISYGNHQVRGRMFRQRAHFYLKKKSLAFYRSKT